MLLPIYHRGQRKPYGSIPRINWDHPLSRNLISYGYDVGCGPIDLVTGGQRTITTATNPPFGGPKASKYGSGLTSIETAGVVAGLYTLPGNSDISNLVVSAPYSFACGIMYTTAPGVGYFERIFSTCDTTSGTPVLIGAANVAADDYFFQFVSGAVQNTTAAGALKVNQFQTLLGVALTGTTTACYVDGALSISPSVTTTGAATPTALPTFHGSRNLAVAVMGGFIYYGALWKNRALTASEARLLHDDPYCFLIYPEDEMFESLVGVSFINYNLMGQIWM